MGLSLDKYVDEVIVSRRGGAVVVHSLLDEMCYYLFGHFLSINLPLVPGTGITRIQSSFRRIAMRLLQAC